MIGTRVGIDQIERLVVRRGDDSVGHVEQSHELDHTIRQHFAGIGIGNVGDVDAQRFRGDEMAFRGCLRGETPFWSRQIT